MSDTVIKVENLSKRYRLGTVGAKTISDDIRRYWARVRGKEDPTLRIGQVNTLNKIQNSNYVWALKDIDFEVKQGEVLGIIGKNGAGKSTLLKILSKVTAPTSGNVKLKGRVASLLEVGTGFHAELTGRENIFLNGAILGMTKAEINSKFDEIVDFSGVERYIDTPVKRYSSGMYVRLAFAVAAHLEPEILVVDEVLAVGDAEFQKKAIGKMQDVSRGNGRTVLFVSHNMAAIENLCSRCLLIKDGQLLMDGDTRETINKYLNLDSDLLAVKISDRKDRKGNQNIVFHNIIFLNDEGRQVTSIRSGDNVIFRVNYIKNIPEALKNCRMSLSISKDERQYFILSSELIIYNSISINKSGFIDFKIDKIPLSKGSYFINLFIESNGIILDWLNKAIPLHIEDGNFYGTGKNYPSGWEGMTVLVEHSINVTEL